MGCSSSVRAADAAASAELCSTPVLPIEPASSSGTLLAPIKAGTWSDEAPRSLKAKVPDEDDRIEEPAAEAVVEEVQVIFDAALRCRQSCSTLGEQDEEWVVEGEEEVDDLLAAEDTLPGLAPAPVHDVVPAMHKKHHRKKGKRRKKDHSASSLPMRMAPRHLNGTQVPDEALLPLESLDALDLCNDVLSLSAEEASLVNPPRPGNPMAAWGDAEPKGLTRQPASRRLLNTLAFHSSQPSPRQAQADTVSPGQSGNSARLRDALAFGSGPGVTRTEVSTLSAEDSAAMMGDGPVIQERSM